MKKLICCVTAAFLSLYPWAGTVSFAESTDAASGTVGEHISWEFADHTLTLSGYGEMEKDAQFTFLSSSLYHVIFDGEITTVSDRAFYHCTSLQTVKLPDTLESIGDGAFFYTNISDLMLPTGCKTIGDSAFSFSTLRTITIPSTVTEIGECTFGIMPEPQTPLPYTYSSVHATIICDADSYAAEYAKKHSLVFFCYGDTNCDGVRNHNDVYKLQEYLTSGKSAEFSMDVNGDMKINASDLTLLKQQFLI